MTSLMPGNTLLRDHDEVRLRVEPPGPSRKNGPGPPGMPSPQGMPQGVDAAHPGEGGTAFTHQRPSILRTAPADPDVSLGALGWLAVLLVAVLLTVLAHAASVHSEQSEHRELSRLPDPAYVLPEQPLAE